MEEYARKDIDLLLGLLLIFSGFLGFLHTSFLRAEVSQHILMGTPTIEITQSGTQDNLDLINLVDEFIASDSIEALVKALKPFLFEDKKKTVVRLFNNRQKMLNRNERITILLGLALQSDHKKERFAFLDLILDPRYQDLKEGKPVLYLAASGSYFDLIPDIIAWYESRVSQEKNADHFKRIVRFNALQYAMRKNDLISLKKLVSYGVMSEDMASQLLYEAMDKRKSNNISEELISFLVSQKAQVNYDDGHYTILMRAVLNDDIDMVKFLIERGADVNKMIDPAVGTALQLAIEHDFIDVDQYLREHGAS